MKLFYLHQVTIAGLCLGVLTATPAVAQSSVYQITDLGRQVFGTGFPPGDSYALNVTPTGISSSSQILCQAGPVYTDQSLPAIWQNGSLSVIPNFSGQAVSLNDAGQILGNNNNIEIWQGGTTTILPALPNSTGGAQSVASGIDNQGDVIANSFTYSSGFPFSPPVGTAFLYQNGLWSNIGTLGGSSTSATAISHNGLVAGLSSTANNQSHVFRYGNSQMTDLGALPGSQGNPGVAGINDSGEVTGTFGTGYGNNSHAFVVKDGVFEDIGTLFPQTSNYMSSHASGINDAGNVIGSAEFLPDNGNSHAFIYENGQMSDLNNLIPAGTGWDLLNATAINDQGQIAGYGYLGFQGGYEAFLLTPNSPVPESSTIISFGALLALGGLAAAVKRKRSNTIF